MSSRRVVSGGDVRIVVQKNFSSGPSSFVHFRDANASFVDKSLAIEAFLREAGNHHLILRPRRCGKSYTLSMIRLKNSCSDLFDVNPSVSETQLSASLKGRPLLTQPIATSFRRTFNKYPILYIDLKDVQGITYEDMLSRFDMMVNQMLRGLSNPYDGLMDENFINFCKELRQPGVIQGCRDRVLETASQDLRKIYGKPVVVLIDEYDSPMHSAIEHGYAASASAFFATVFGSLLKNNDAVYASMMVGICRIAKYSWLSQLNHLKIFPMHAEDDRYAKIFLFTEKEVEILCNTYAHGRLKIEALQARYNGYTARCGPGFVNLYNPLSVVRALEAKRISNFWVETGRHSPLSQKLWQAGPEFRDNLDLLLTQKSVKLVMDDHINFLNYDADSGLWGLLYYAGYLTIQEFGEQSSEYVFRIPNGEVTSEWHEWVVGYLTSNRVACLSDVYDNIIGGDPKSFQRQFTAFLQKYLALYCTPHHKEKVYQALCYMLIFALFGKEYDVRMEQDSGHGRSDITAHPFSQQRFLAFIFEIKAVASHLTRNGKQSLKTAERMKKDLEKAKIEALTQIAERRYRERVPRHATTVHEYAFVFCGKFCVAAVQTFESNAMEDWQQVAAGATVISECMVDGTDEEDFTDEDA
ncbi:DUF1703-domain-containing protein [Phlegmacium glaucopus]|nr:DUF1703-domain-containing protein [Phlegmacium glaucopus]